MTILIHTDIITEDTTKVYSDNTYIRRKQLQKKTTNVIINILILSQLAYMEEIVKQNEQC